MNKTYKGPWLSEAMCKVTHYVLGPKAAKKFLLQISQWVRCRGPRDTIRRLKGIKTSVDLRLDGKHDKADALLHELSLSWGKKYMAPWRVLYNSLVYCKSDVKASRIYTILNLYTGLHYNSNVAQKEDLLSTVSDYDSAEGDLISMIITSRMSEPQKSFDKQFTKILFDLFPPDSSGVNRINIVKCSLLSLNHAKVRSRNIEGSSKLNSYKYITEKLIDDFQYNDLPEDYHDYEWIDTNLNNTNLLSIYLDASKANIYRERMFSAELAIIPKSGSDGRVIAKLPLWEQLLMQDIHKKLETFRSQYSFFCWKQQKDMVAFATSSETFCSTDIKSATDLIPRELFYQYLKHVGTMYEKNYIELWKVHHNYHKRLVPSRIKKELQKSIARATFEVISRIEHICTQKFFNKDTEYRLSYSVGQPMGMLGSFPILDITNYLLASFSDNTDSNFRIVGDDIIFNNKDTMSSYINTCKMLDIPISDTKTYDNGFAQAVGRSITASWTAMPMKFSNHVHVHDKKMKMWYGALFPHLIKMSPDLSKRCREEWRDYTYNLNLEQPSNAWNFSKARFIQSQANALGVVTKKSYDKRKFNHRPLVVKCEEDKQINDLINSASHEAKLALENLNTSSIYNIEAADSSGKSLEQRAPWKGDLSVSVPHTLMDRYIHQNIVEHKQAKKVKTRRKTR